MEAQRYQVTQDDKDYILSTNIINNKIRIECQDNNFNGSQIYVRELSKNELLSLSNIFNYLPSLTDIENELNNAIENQQVQITNLGSSINILFNLRINSFNQEITIQLLPIPMQKNQNITIIQKIPSTQKINPIIIKQPIYNNPNFAVTTFEDDYPDCTYSTKAPEVYQSMEVKQEYGLPLDQDRITKIELNSNLVKTEHDRLLQRLNNLKVSIEMFKKHTSNLRKENGFLNMKTLELKKIYRDLLEAEASLMAENDDLKRERHELTLKTNELDFYMKDHQDFDNVREVKIPIEQKRRRPTNVSKTEKQFGGGYTSNSGKKGYISSSPNKGYTSTMASKTPIVDSRNKIEDYY